MSDRLQRLRELQEGGFEVAMITSDPAGIDVRLYNPMVTVTLRLRREDARALLYGGGVRVARPPRTLVRP